MAATALPSAPSRRVFTSPRTETGPLAELIVIDLTRALAGPHAGMMLCDLCDLCDLGANRCPGTRRSGQQVGAEPPGQRGD
jgi:hypothetical protein